MVHLENLGGLLSGLHYHVASEDPWTRQGIYPHTGSCPMGCLVEQRWRVALMLLEAAKSTAWLDPDRAASAVAAERLATA